jgi:hypothetical protein
MKALITTLLLIATVTHAEDTTLTVRLKAIMIPDLTITNQTIDTAVNIILEECAKTQTNAWCPGVILNLADPDSTGPQTRTTIQAQNISVFTAFHQLATRNHLNCTIEDNAIVLTRKRIVEPAGGAYGSPAAGEPSAHP